MQYLTQAAQNPQNMSLLVVLAVPCCMVFVLHHPVLALCQTQSSSECGSLIVLELNGRPQILTRQVFPACAESRQQSVPGGPPVCAAAGCHWAAPAVTTSGASCPAGVYASVGNVQDG
jgi:hypothetical protein